MDKSKIIEETIIYTKEKMQNLAPSHGWDHVQRVINLARKIARTENADPFIVELGAILHDITREEENRSEGKICHAQLGSKFAYDYLKEKGLDEENIKKIAECVKTHRFRNSHKPETIEAKIIFDADKLDSIGAIGIGRSFLFAGEVGARLHDPEVDIEKTKPYSIDDTAFREYKAKLQHLHNKMLTDEGRRIAKDRHEFMVEYFDRLNAEYNGIL